jgi:hypothetical protein
MSGGIAFSNTLSAPTISGLAQILDARFTPPPPWPEVRNLEARIRFANTEAVADHLQFQLNAMPLYLRGRFTSSPPNFSLTLTPARGALVLADAPPSGSDLSTVRLLGEGKSEGEPLLREVVARGKIGAAPSSLTLFSQAGRAAPAQTTYFFPAPAERGSPLLLRAVSPEPGSAFR